MRVMRIKPVLTEKAIAMAGRGVYSFFVPLSLGKTQVKEAIEKGFDVKVVDIKSMNYKGGVSLDMRKRRKRIPARKKVMVKLKDGKKIDLFGEEK